MVSLLFSPDDNSSDVPELHACTILLKFNIGYGVGQSTLDSLVLHLLSALLPLLTTDSGTSVLKMCMQNNETDQSSNTHNDNMHKQ